MARNRHKITVGLVPLGCPKNVVDSERMLAEIAQAGFPITTEPDNADVVVVNTCGFIAPAEAESLGAIKRAVDCKRRGAVKKVVVAGCLSEKLGTELTRRIEGIDAVIGLAQRDNIAQIIENFFYSSRHSDRKTSDEPILSPPCPPTAGPSAGRVLDDRCRLLITPGHWAYLRISEGCDRRCSFCTIPSIRGRFRSKPLELVLAEAEELAAAGAVELNIIAQDTTYYGRDSKTSNGLSALVKELDKVAHLAWLRLMYLYPTGIDKTLIETIAESEKAVCYLDIPIQHVSDSILRSMGRPDTKDKLRRLIEDLRRAMPDSVLRTTLMVGFPGETDRQFEELIDFVKWAQFDALGCFRFYPESGTRAARLPGQVPDEVKEQRLDELMRTQQKIAFAKNENRIGQTLRCLVDSVERDGLCRARFYGQAPEIDSVCIIRDGRARPGQFIDAKVVAAQDYDLVVEQI
ncbi:MAG: 30S ribosomal protein S12 methylthiotransferase RimO [Planctomycetota bacterium]